MEIGSHTLNHHSFKLTSLVEAKIQLEKSKAFLQDLSGQTVYSFAYPFGIFRSDQIALVKAADYLTAVSTKAGVWQSPDNQFYLSRLRPGRKVGSQFADWLGSF